MLGIFDEDSFLKFLFSRILNEFLVYCFRNFTKQKTKKAFLVSICFLGNLLKNASKGTDNFNFPETSIN